eukprot:TRINITY_DN10445_c1_g1_i1.p1 TRINITY_DN10445_c1_g1~~TRINITY_DN10445_c1_g1_i1.p1  ORF type:complete len:392 (+),score=73.35 TRINITY_DN10445_c1_g1_i1:39-1214(+)
MLVGQNKRFYVGSSAYLGPLEGSPQYQRCIVKGYLADKDRFRVAYWDPTFRGKEVFVHENNLTFDFWAAPGLLLPRLAPGLHVAQFGDAGKGLMSSREFQEGEVIIEESPMMVVSNKGGKARRWSLYFETECELGEATEVLIAFQELSNGGGIDAFIDDAKALFKKMLGVVPGGAAAHVERMAGRDTSSLHSQVRRIAEVLARWHSNCHSFTLPGSQENISALYRHSSKANHSCDPNCSAAVDQNTGSMILKAKRTIMPGEQLTTNYLSVLPKFLDLPVQERRRRLSMRGFFCLCSRCSEEGGAALSSRRPDMRDPAKEDVNTSNITATEYREECQSRDTNASEPELVSGQSNGSVPGCECHRLLSRMESSTTQLKKDELHKCLKCAGYAS